MAREEATRGNRVRGATKWQMFLASERAKATQPIQDFGIFAQECSQKWKALSPAQKAPYELLVGCPPLQNGQK